MQDIALGLAGLHKVHMDVFLKPVKIPFLQHVNCTTQFIITLRVHSAPLSALLTFVAQLCLASGFARSPFFLLHLVLSFLFTRVSSCLMLFHVIACWT